jgi:hypothetical protein
LRQALPLSGCWIEDQSDKERRRRKRRREGTYEPIDTEELRIDGFVILRIPKRQLLPHDFRHGVIILKL